MGALKPYILTILQKKGELRAINLIKEKNERKTKREDMRIWTTLDMLHNQRRRILFGHFPGSFVNQPRH